MNLLASDIIDLVAPWCPEQGCWEGVRYLVVLYWVVALFADVAAASIPFISRHVLAYGKQREASANSNGIGALTVLKSWFTSFYLVGTVCTLALYILTPRDVLILYLAHVLRRLVEELSAPKSDARMHVVGLLVGLSFYVVAPLSLAQPWALADSEADRFLEFPAWRLGLGLALVAYGSVHQHACHVILRTLRLQGKYSLPRGDWFDLGVAAPHYLAEMVIYVGFLVLSPSTESALILGFTAVNLSITAQATYEWYAARYPGAFRWRVLPFLF